MSPVRLAKFQRAPALSFLISSGSTKKEPRYAFLSEAMASHSHKMWTEVSSSVPHFLQVGLLLSPIIYKYLLKALCPVRRLYKTCEVFFLLALSTASESYVPTFRNTLFHIHRLCEHTTYRYGTKCYETSANKIQTLWKQPQERIYHPEHGESVKSRRMYICDNISLNSHLK